MKWKKIIITQILIFIIVTTFDRIIEIILNGQYYWDIQDVVIFTILDIGLIIKQMK